MRVLIADDHDLLRDTLSSFLTAVGNIEVVMASDFHEAQTYIAKHLPFDLIVLDYDMPGMNGLDGLKALIATGTRPRVALMSGDVRREVVEEALAIGAAGFLPKTLKATSVVSAIKFMVMGEQYAPVDFMIAETEEAQTHPFTTKLSKRELQVLEGLHAGKSNKEISRDLGLAEPTVKLHMKTLYRKLDVRNRTQAALVAKEAGIF